MAIANHNYDFDKMVEKAIIYLVHSFVRTGHNPKPVILHSIRVGIYLYNQNYNQDIVVAALLHDLLEDTDIKKEEIEKVFGSGVAKLVEANTFDISIINKNDRDTEMINRCKECGKEALIIKAIDILDNSEYFYHLSKNEEDYGRVLRKMKYFIKISSEELGKEPAWQLLKKKYDEVVQA